MAERNVLEAIRNALDEEMERDPRVMLLGLDIGRLGGVFRTTAGLLAKYGESRVIDMPVAEAGMVGASLGLAIAGMRPVVELQFLGFSTQAYHQIGPQLAKYRQRSVGRFSAHVTIRAPFGGYMRNPEFHSDSMDAQFSQWPGLKIVMPVTPYDAKGLLLEAIRDPDPVLFCEPARLYRLLREEVPDGDYTVPFGKARIVRSGSALTFVSWSSGVEMCERAAEALAQSGIEATVLDLRTLVPLDVETLVSEVRKTGRCVIFHEAPLTAGFGAEVAATLYEELFFSLDAPIARVASFDIPYPRGAAERWYLPTLERLVQTAMQVAQI